MSWHSFVFILVPLLQLDVLAAETYMGNSRNWNSRDLNFRRPLQVDSRPNGVIQPIHALPRPLPKPIEIQTEVNDESKTVISEIILEESQPAEIANEQPIGRSNYQIPQRFNLQRRPVLSNQPSATVAPPAPVAATPKLEVIDPVPEPIASEPAEIPSVSPPTPPEEPISVEDIEVFPQQPSPIVSSHSPPLRHYLMPRPIPKPTSNEGYKIPQQIQPISLPTDEPVRSVTIIKSDPAPEPEEKPMEVFIPETELSLPKSGISEVPPVSIATTGNSEVGPSTPMVYLIPVPEDEEPVLIEDEKISEIIETPDQVSMVQTPVPIASSPSLSNNLIRRPIPRRPPPLAPVKPIPSVMSTEKPMRLISPTRSPSYSKPLIPSRVTVRPPVPAPVKIPQVMPTKSPSYGKSLEPMSASRTVDAELIDYPCGQANAYYGVANDCDSYVECESYAAMMLSCPDGLHFNSRAVWPEYPCAYPSEVKCESNAIRQKAQPTDECPRQYGLFPIADSDCSQYILCQEGLATVMNCPPGLVFNSGTNTCDWPANVPSCSPSVFRGFTCPAPPLEEDGSPSDMITKYRYGQSCKEYVACQLGHPRLLSCDPGLSFDEISEVCVDSEYVQNCRP